jgi:G3E family GTPase
MDRTRLAIMGGFLGAGKTKAMLKLAEYLGDESYKAALITNDQSVGLVDTARVEYAGYHAKEVTGSCFCCNFNGLMEASKSLVIESSPDVLIIEPVGSCTDLRATIGFPLNKFYKDDYEVLPLSVLVDPIRFGQVMGIVEGKSFSEKVLYIYKKQLEEAEIIVINKVDLLDPELRASLVEIAKKQFPHAKIFEVSCLTGEGLKEWFDEILHSSPAKYPAMDVDYDIYADGEALLGWINITASIGSDHAYDGTAFLLDLTKEIRDELKELDIEIAHLKMTLSEENAMGLACVSLTQTNAEPQVVNTLDRASGKNQLRVNMRAEADPEILKNRILDVLNRQDAKIVMNEVHAFRPGRPTPTHRLEVYA